MRPEIRTRILELSRTFYSRFAGEFSATRQRIQPGVQRILHDAPLDSTYLDLGCGNGSVSRSLAELGHSASYVGIDSSEELIRIARSDNTHPHASFHCADLAVDEWPALLDSYYNRVVSFATLHHIPGQAERNQIVQNAARKMADGARMIVSTWNFLASPRYRQRLLPWQSVGIQDNEIENGDYLLDWRRGGTGTRYVHFFSEDDLALLGQHAGLEVEESFFSDGRNGILGLYQVWRKADPAA